MFHSLVLSQRKISYWLDRKWLPAEYSVDGNASFDADFVTEFLRPGSIVIDVGGGKRPAISAARKTALNLTVVGFDINADELAASPPGSYDRCICADVTKYTGDMSADFVICSALLEHVTDVASALKAVASMLKPGGTALLFIPSRNSLAARINLLLPQSFKQWLLHMLFPEMRNAVGFPAYYDRCTPREIEKLGVCNGLVCEKMVPYFASGYFTVLVPMHVAWRIYQRVQRLVIGTEAAECFSLALRKASTGPQRQTLKVDGAALDSCNPSPDSYAP
jgi:2-polyprenyl-6-hydroxyphenyl methylase/3-demethylubiquinone-9 3-methyltransferase